MAFEVIGMKLIPQTKTMGCWYASARMLIDWRQRKSQMCLADLVPAELDKECRKLRNKNKGMTDPQVIKMAKRLGLVAIPPMTPTPQMIENWLKTYGPLWVNGKTHIVVIAGIKKVGSSYKLKVYDPGPVNRGKIDWRDLTNWYLLGKSVSTRYLGAAHAIFLHCPRV